MCAAPVVQLTFLRTRLVFKFRERKSSEHEMGAICKVHRPVEDVSLVRNIFIVFSKCSVDHLRSCYNPRKIRLFETKSTQRGEKNPLTSKHSLRNKERVQPSSAQKCCIEGIDEIIAQQLDNN